MSRTIQDDILTILSESPDQSMPVDDLILRVKEKWPLLRMGQIRAALLPLMSADRVEFTDDEKIELRKQPALSN